MDYIRQYYSVPAEIGRDVTVSGRKGTITSDKGAYIGVTFHDDKKLNSLPCHPTSEVVYLDSFTELKNLQTKNSRSKARYDKYLESEYPGTFAEFLGITKKHKI